jgi:WD40 repeat protein
MERTDTAIDTGTENQLQLTPDNRITLNGGRARLGSRRALLLGFARCAASAMLAAGLTIRVERAGAGGQADDMLPVVITAGTDHAVKHWDTSGRLLGAIGMHADAISALAYAHGELVCAVNNGKLKGINLSTGKTDFEVKAHLEGPITLALSSDGTLLATGGADSALRLWDGKSGHFYSMFAKAHGGPITALQLTSDRSRLVSGSSDRLIRIWQIAGDAKHPTIEYQANIVAHDDVVNAISLSPDDKMIASVSGDGSLKIWSLMGGALIQRVRLGSGGLSVAFSPDGHTVATGSADGKIRLWNPENGMVLPFVASHENGVVSLAWAPDG